MCRGLWLSFFTLTIALTGCLGPQTRMQSAEDVERDKDLDAVCVVGDVTDVGNAEGLQVSAVGLVTDLEGTGGSPRGEFRTMLEKDLRQRKIDKVAQLLDSPNNALVFVTGFIPAGCRKLDAIDLQVTLPEPSPATSLKGGYLQPCILRNYETTKNLDPEYKGGNRLLQGHILGIGKGPLLVGMGDGDDLKRLRRARVWEGGASLIERPFFLVLKKPDGKFLKKDEKLSRVANAVATRINAKFPEDSKKQDFVEKHRQLFLLEDVTQHLNDAFEGGALSHVDVAKAIDKGLVNVRVPYAYRYNPERYLRIVRLVPLAEDAEQQARYRARLKKMLAEPQDCIRAALRLEALGKESIPVLKEALTNPAPLVRFAAAESLLYLGSTAGVEELASAARTEPRVRAYALIALAGLNESVCRMKLQELLAQDDAELRAGAFQSLRLSYAHECRNDKEVETAMRRLGGEDLLAFWLHQIPTTGARAVNYAMTKRAEIILFGQDIHLVAPVRIRVGEEFVVTADAGDDRCFLSRITQEGEQRQTCSVRLDDVLRRLVELGGQYPDAIDLLRKLDDQQGLNCPVQVLTPPQALPLQDLLAESRSATVK